MAHNYCLKDVTPLTMGLMLSVVVKCLVIRPSLALLGQGNIWP